MQQSINIDDITRLIGQEIGKSEWLEVTQDMISKFAHATGDHQWIHLNKERCANELGTPTVAHGYLLTSLIPQFSYQILKFNNVKQVINYGMEKMRFISPVHPGAEVRGVFQLETAEKQKQKESWRLCNKVTLQIKGYDKPAMIAFPISLFYF